MYRIVIGLFLLALLGPAGCGSKSHNPGPLTEEMKQKIKEDDQRIEDEERKGSGTAKQSKKRR